MNPLLVTGGLSLASDLVGGIADRIRNRSTNVANANSAPSVSFAELLSKAGATPKLQAASFLESKGLSSVADAEHRISTLTQDLLQSPELQSVVGANGGSFTLSLQTQDSVTIKLANGTERTIKIPDSAKAGLQEARELLSAIKEIQTPTGVSTAKAILPLLAVTPGSPVTLRSPIA